MNKEQLEQKLGQLVIKITKAENELRKLRKEANETAISISEIEGRK